MPADQRRHLRTSVDLGVEFVVKESGQRGAGRVKDISLGGMSVQTEAPPAFGAQVVVHLAIPGQKAPLALPGVVRWSRDGDGMGIQFGLLGARETHAITELTKAR